MGIKKNTKNLKNYFNVVCDLKRGGILLSLILNFFFPMLLIYAIGSKYLNLIIIIINLSL